MTTSGHFHITYGSDSQFGIQEMRKIHIKRQSYFILLLYYICFNINYLLCIHCESSFPHNYTARLNIHIY